MWNNLRWITGLLVTKSLTSPNMFRTVEQHATATDAGVRPSVHLTEVPTSRQRTKPW